MGNLSNSFLFLHDFCYLLREIKAFGWNVNNVFVLLLLNKLERELMMFGWLIRADVSMEM